MITTIFSEDQGQLVATEYEDSGLTSAGEVLVVPKSQPEQIQAVLIAAAHFIVQVLSQDARFRMQGKAISDELGSVMDALGIHYDGCKCGCKGQ